MIERATAVAQGVDTAVEDVTVNGEEEEEEEGDLEEEPHEDGEPPRGSRTRAAAQVAAESPRATTEPRPKTMAKTKTKTSAKKDKLLSKGNGDLLRSWETGQINEMLLRGNEGGDAAIASGEVVETSRPVRMVLRSAKDTTRGDPREDDEEGPIDDEELALRTRARELAAEMAKVEEKKALLSLQRQEVTLRSEGRQHMQQFAREIDAELTSRVGTLGAERESRRAVWEAFIDDTKGKIETLCQVMEEVQGKIDAVEEAFAHGEKSLRAEAAARVKLEGERVDDTTQMRLQESAGASGWVLEFRR